MWGISILILFLIFLAAKCLKNMAEIDNNVEQIFKNEQTTRKT
jgi:hypothetical protein